MIIVYFTCADGGSCSNFSVYCSRNKNLNFFVMFPLTTSLKDVVVISSTSDNGLSYEVPNFFI